MTHFQPTNLFMKPRIVNINNKVIKKKKMTRTKSNTTVNLDLDLGTQSPINTN